VEEEEEDEEHFILLGVTAQRSSRVRYLK